MPDIQIRSADELATGVSLQPADFHALVNNASLQSGAIGDKTAITALEASDELLIKQSGALKKISWSNVAAEVASDFSLTTSSVDEGKSDFYTNWDTPNTAKNRLVTDGFLPISKAATSEHPVIDVMAYGALGDNSGTVVAQWLSGGTYDRGYATLAAIQADYPWVESLLDTIDFAACQKALDVAWSKIKATYGLLEDTSASAVLLAQSGSDTEHDKTRTARSVEVFFPTGWYKLNKTLIVPPSCVVTGTGSGSSVLRYIGDKFNAAGEKKSTDYSDAITVGSQSETLARTLNGRKWKYYSDKTDYKVPSRLDGMHAIMLVRDELKYTTANVTTGIYHNVGTVTAGGSLSAATTFTVNNGSGYAEGASSIVYNNGSTLSATTFYAEGGSYYTSTNALAASGTLTGGTLTNPFSGAYYEDGVDDNEKFYAQQSLTVSSTGQRIYPGTKIDFPNGVFVVAANEAASSTALVGYVESGSIASSDVGTIDVYSQGYNPTGCEQGADESAAAGKNRVQDMDGCIRDIGFSSYAEDDTIGIWLAGFTHRNCKYTNLNFRGYSSFTSSHISGTPNDSSKGMFGIMLNSGSANQSRTLGDDLKITNNTFEACYAGAVITGDSQGIVFSENHLKFNRFGVRLNGLHHNIANNRFDGFTTATQTEAPHRIGETAIYLRYPVGCIINGNSIEHQQRAVELYGTTNVSVNGNSVTVPDPAGRTGTVHDYTQAHGFVVHATAVTYAYAEDGDGDAYRHNAGLLVTGNNWKYNDYTPATYSPLYINGLTTNQVFGSAYGNGSWPTNIAIETLRTDNASNPNHSQNFVVDENGLNKIHTVFTNKGLHTARNYGLFSIADCYGIARGTITTADGNYIVILPNPKLNDAPNHPMLSGNKFDLSVTSTTALDSGATTVKVRTGSTITGLGKANEGGGDNRLKVTTGTMHGLEVGDKVDIIDVSNTGESSGTFTAEHTVAVVDNSTQFTVNTVISGAISAATSSGVMGAALTQNGLVTNLNATSGSSTIVSEVSLYAGSSAHALKTFSGITLDNIAGESGHYVIK